MHRQGLRAATATIGIVRKGRCGTSRLPPFPPVAVITSHPAGRVAIDLRLDVNDAEVTQGRGVDTVQQSHSFALRTPCQEAACEGKNGAKRTVTCLFRPSGK